MRASPRPANRVINGSAVEVLPRLTDGAYDLVFVDADKSAYNDLSRTGGPAAAAARRDRRVRPTRCGTTGSPTTTAPRRPTTVTIREMGARPSATIRASSRRMLPVGDGLLAAVKL